MQSISQLLTVLFISCRIDFILRKIEANNEVLELLANSYMPMDRDRCQAVFLKYHKTAFETLGHTTPPIQNTLSKLHAAVIRRLVIQQSIFPRGFVVSNIRHEKHVISKLTI